MNFIEAAQHFYQDGGSVKTTTVIHTDDIIDGKKLLLRDYKLYLIDGNYLVNIDYVTSGKYSRANVHVVKPDYVDNIVLDFKDNKMELNRKISCEIKAKSLFVFTINQKKLSMSEPQLLIEAPKNSGKSKTLIDKYKEYMSGITDEAIKEEFGYLNIDLPQYGVIGDRLIIINEDDEFINRMMIYEKCDIRGKPAEVLSMYKFSQDLQTMQTHILCGYIMIVDRKMEINIELDNFMTVVPNSDSMFNIPLKYSRYREYDMKSIVKMFNREYEYGSWH